MTMERWMLMAVAVACVGVAKPAQAQTETKPVLLVLYADADKLSDEERQGTLDETRKELVRYEKYTLMDTPKIDLLDEMVNFECLEMDAECLSKIGGKHKADLVLYTRWEGGKLTMTLASVADKKVLGTWTGEVKKEKVKEEAARTAVGKVFGPVPEKPKPPQLVTVKVNANVEAAEVFVNQKRMGVTPLEMKLQPGKYVVSLRKKDFLMVEEEVDVPAGEKPVELSFTLKPVLQQKTVVVTPVTPPGKKDEKKEEPTPFYATWWFWTAVGVGVAAIAGGTAAAVSGGESTYDVGTVKFSVNPSAAEHDYLFYPGKQ